MTPDPQPAKTLVTILERENAALAAMDLRRATALLAEKSAAVDAYATSCRTRTTAPQRDLVARIDTLVAENGALLDRAMNAQREILAAIVTATRRARGGATRYTARGTMAGDGRTPMAMLSRA